MTEKEESKVDRDVEDLKKELQEAFRVFEQWCARTAQMSEVDRFQKEEPQLRRLTQSLKAVEQKIEQLLEEQKPQIIRQSFLGYLRCMWSLAWTAFRYPHKTTIIDWSTGEVLAEPPAEEEVFAVVRPVDG